MKICFIVDFRSPIARNWIGGFAQKGHEIHVISTYPCPSEKTWPVGLDILSLGLNGLGRPHRQGKAARNARRGKTIPSLLSPFVPLARSMHHAALGTATTYWRASRARKRITAIHPDVVHALRIPFEGILAGRAVPEWIPLVISTWGNDITFFARRYRAIRFGTTQALKRADGLMSDTSRDIRLARTMGFCAARPAILLPGAGGVKRDIFYPGREGEQVRKKWGIRGDGPVVVFPRRLRPGNVCAAEFFSSIPLVLKEERAVFICPGLAGNPEVEGWIRGMGIGAQTLLMPELDQMEMAELFRLSDIVVSPTLYDGTPNSLLEAMACGCFPVVGPLDSVREWIADRSNGLECDPRSPESQAATIIAALKDPPLRERAREHNLAMVRERADYHDTIRGAEKFYDELISGAGRASQASRNGLAD